MDVSLVVFLCVLGGALLRTAYGFLGKIIESPPDQLKFDAKFAATLLASFLAAAMSAVLAFAAFPVPEGVPVIYVVAAALSFGYALNDAVNRGLTTYQSKGN
jgi:hypothetical protein